MPKPDSVTTTLPHPKPACPYASLLLFAVRRMAAGGLNDAIAAQAMIGGFGIGFRRPLVLIRALMAEVARVASVRLLVAPCCCRRMTDDEHVLIDAIRTALAQPEAAHDALCGLLRVRSCLGLLTSAQAVHASFADAGMPIGLLDRVD